MLLTVNFDVGEKMTNIGFAKAIIDTGCFQTSDLDEIGTYLTVYSHARAIESLDSSCAECKGGDE